MDFHGPAFVLAIIAISTGGWIINNWIRAKHGYEPTSDWGGFGGRRHRRVTRFGGFASDDGNLDDARKIMLLTGENEKLTGQVSRLEERIAVLERIATDPAERTAREIDALRDRN
ncbi:conserved hypothetical protein [Sphingomonas sp. EC-HK361]|uniref:hypothetical protein n=1 Tax=Sphingomonas sp. EC-HK361 TaxID=2038397 RepID=UPI0012519F96|nr:hypothetical protein [Sphingomonas sp. EC-HK361]VVT22777.1 conserved hypothetical protein [Sphingomonas sp. EC-HK361]